MMGQPSTDDRLEMAKQVRDCLDLTLQLADKLTSIVIALLKLTQRQ